MSTEQHAQTFLVVKDEIKSWISSSELGKNGVEFQDRFTRFSRTKRGNSALDHISVHVVCGDAFPLKLEGIARLYIKDPGQRKDKKYSISVILKERQIIPQGFDLSRIIVALGKPSISCHVTPAIYFYGPIGQEFCFRGKCGIPSLGYPTLDDWVSKIKIEFSYAHVVPLFGSNPISGIDLPTPD